MSKESSVIFSVLNFKCPRCHKGNLFTNKSSYQFKGFFDMPNNCLKCNQDFQLEAGFYLGAMFVSYALTVAISIAVFVLFVIFDAYSLVPFLIAASIVMTLSTPYLIKISRSIWIAFSIKYDPNAIKEYETHHKSK